MYKNEYIYIRIYELDILHTYYYYILQIHRSIYRHINTHIRLLFLNSFFSGIWHGLAQFWPQETCKYHVFMQNAAKCRFWDHTMGGEGGGVGSEPRTGIIYTYI